MTFESSEMSSHLVNIETKLKIFRTNELPKGIDLNSLTDHNDKDAATNNLGNNNHDTKKLNLPQPSFRIISDQRDRRKFHTLAKRRNRGDFDPLSYYHHVEPSPEDILARLDYDMDNMDEIWLKALNQKYERENIHISADDFERIMDRLEKESFFCRPDNADDFIDEEAICSVCEDGTSFEGNQIMFCDMCDLAVHQECYGVPYVPEGIWLCRRCLQSPSKSVKCCLCPNYGGAFKQTDDNRWAHVICALWIPEVCFANAVFMEPIDNVSHIPAARWKLMCYICKKKGEDVGACIQCHKPNCYVPFHVTCARQANLHFKIRKENYKGSDGVMYPDVMKEAFCDAHTPKNRRKSKGIYEYDSDDDDETYKKKKKNKKQRENMKQARKVLAEKRNKATTTTCQPEIDEAKLSEIAKFITFKGSKRKTNAHLEEMRPKLMSEIHKYWEAKRIERRGVPLLRGLHTAYINNRVNPRQTPVPLQDATYQQKYTKLRYDLEKSRLLVGEVKKRELIKKRMFKVSKTLFEAACTLADKEEPANQE